MARLAYADPAQLSSTAQQLVASIPVQNIVRMLAHAQSDLEPILLLVRAILVDQQLSAQLRELAILQVAKLAQARYEWVQHVPIAKSVGVTDEQIALVEQGRDDTPAFDSRAKCVLRVAQEVMVSPTLSEETFVVLQTSFSPREIVELLLTIGCYLMLGRIMTVLEVDLEPSVGDALMHVFKQQAS